jgi:adenosylhomocysteine nucleosidase
LATRKLHIFTAIQSEAKAIAPFLPTSVELTVIGIRAVRLPKRVEATAIIMAGFAGALDPALEIGDIIHDEPAGIIHTSRSIIATTAEKSSLFLSTGARAVDMENEIVRDFARQMGVPFFGIRAISDRANEALDPRVLELVDEVGTPIAGAIALGLLKSPFLVGTLNRLRINTSIAGRALAAAVKNLLDENRELLG